MKSCRHKKHDALLSPQRDNGIRSSADSELEAMISSSVDEGFNGKAKLTTRKAYGLKTPQGIELALFHPMVNLPEPECTHRFC